MANPAYETVALVLSNVTVLLPVVSALLRWDGRGAWRPLLLDATFFAITGASSVNYHLCQSADWCWRQSLTQLRPTDHIFVWTLGTWVGVRGLRLKVVPAVVLTLWGQWAFTTFSSLLITTLSFPAIAVVFFCTAFLARSAVFKTPLEHLGIFSVVWGTFMLGLGVGLYLLADDIEGETFWIWHSIWHALAFLGLWLIWEGVTRYPYWRIFGTARVYAFVDREMRDFFAWEDGIFLDPPQPALK